MKHLALFENFHKNRKFFDQTLLKQYDEVDQEIRDLYDVIYGIEDQAAKKRKEVTKLGHRLTSLRNKLEASTKVSFKEGQILYLEDLEDLSDDNYISLGNGSIRGLRYVSNIEIIKVNAKSVKIRFKATSEPRHDGAGRWIKKFEGVKELIKNVPMDRMKRIYYEYVNHRNYAEMISTKAIQQINK